MGMRAPHDKTGTLSCSQFRRPCALGETLATLTRRTLARSPDYPLWRKFIRNWRKAVAQRCQIRGQRAIERQAACRYRMLEAEMAGMQGLPVESFNRSAHAFAEPP